MSIDVRHSFDHRLQILNLPRGPGARTTSAFKDDKMSENIACASDSDNNKMREENYICLVINRKV